MKKKIIYTMSSAKEAFLIIWSAQHIQIENQNTRKINRDNYSETNYSFIHGFLEYFMGETRFHVLRYTSILVFCILNGLVLSFEKKIMFWILADFYRLFYRPASPVTTIGNGDLFIFHLPSILPTSCIHQL